MLVVIFAAYPVAVATFRSSNTPKRFIPAAVLLGGATFTLSGIPGTPSIQNAMPIAFFGTDAFAAPGVGTIGGLGLALGMLGKTYLAAATAAGISPELLHRVAAIACGGLDSLPHNGAVITMLGICRLTHREAYFDMFMVSVVGPLLALFVVLVAGSTFGTF